MSRAGGGRVLKFRAWNGKKMLPWDWIVSMGFLQRVLTNSGYTPMQCTGLVDTNGTDIYEGDLVKLHDVVLVVVYQPPAFVMKKSIKHKSWHEFVLHYRARQFCEVIGNRYEHPELVKVT